MARVAVRSEVLLIATGSRPAFDPLGPFNVDYQGTVNLVTAAKAKGYKKVTLRRAVILRYQYISLLPAHGEQARLELRFALPGDLQCFHRPALKRSPCFCALKGWA